MRAATLKMTVVTELFRVCAQAGWIVEAAAQSMSANAPYA
jgi:hypothetical protein